MLVDYEEKSKKGENSRRSYTLSQ